MSTEQDRQSGLFLIFRAFVTTITLHKSERNLKNLKKLDTSGTSILLSDLSDHLSDLSVAHDKKGLHPQNARTHQRHFSTSARSQSLGSRGCRKWWNDWYAS